MNITLSNNAITESLESSIKDFTATEFSRNEIEKSNSSLQLALNDLSIKNKEVIDSINYATYIQQAALPNISQIISDQLQFELFKDFFMCFSFY